MARELVDDALWEIIEPLLPPIPAHKSPAGRKRLDNRRVLTGILFILQTGLPWDWLPKEMGCGSGMTLLAPCPRLAASRGVGRTASHPAFQAAQRPPTRFLTRDRRLLVGTCGAWGKKTGPNPTDRRKAGSKHHLLVDSGGTPAEHSPHWRQPARFDATDAAAGRHSQSRGKAYQA